MRTIDYLFNPDFVVLREIYGQALLAGLAVVLMAGILSVLVVVKRLGFIGQGISHSAFGGIGLASVLAAVGVTASGGAGEFVVIVIFCVAAALGIAAASERRGVPADTAIGVFLVASMAGGAILVQAGRAMAASRGRAADIRSWESILFGSITSASREEIMAGWALNALVLSVLWWMRRPLLAWAFDEESARAFGVPTARIRQMLMIMLAVAVVTAMKLAGVVLATALLVLPGAIALKLSSRLGGVLVCSCGAGVLGLVGGMVLSIEADWQTGPSVVLVLTAMLVGALAWERLRPAPATLRA